MKRGDRHFQGKEKLKGEEVPYNSFERKSGKPGIRGPGEGKGKKKTKPRGKDFFSKKSKRTFLKRTLEGHTLCSEMEIKRRPAGKSAAKNLYPFTEGTVQEKLREGSALMGIWARVSRRVTEKNACVWEGEFYFRGDSKNQPVVEKKKETINSVKASKENTGCVLISQGGGIPSPKQRAQWLVSIRRGEGGKKHNCTITRMRTFYDKQKPRSENREEDFTERRILSRA